MNTGPDTLPHGHIKGTTWHEELRLVQGNAATPQLQSDSDISVLESSVPSAEQPIEV